MSPDEHQRGRQQSPRDHDSRNPFARANPHEHQVARHLEQRVADEKDSRANAERRGAEPEVAIHLQRRETNIRAVEEVEDVEHEHERDQPKGDPSHRLLLER